MLVNQRPHGSHPQKLIKCIKKPSKTPQTSKSSKYYYQEEKLIFLALFYKTFRVCIGWLSVEKGHVPIAGDTIWREAIPFGFLGLELVIFL